MDESKTGKGKMRRRKTISVSFNDRELEAIDEFCQMFKAHSRTAVIRESAIRYVMEKLIERKSSLFPDYDEETLFAGEPCDGTHEARINAHVAKDLMCGQSSLFSADELKGFTQNTNE